MHKWLPVVLLLPFSLSSHASGGSGQMKPGLWEVTVKSDEMKNMPQLSPEQQEQMKRMGINIPDTQGGGVVTKVCITREMAERGVPPAPEQKEMGCESKNFQRSGNTYSGKIVCNGSAMKGEGKVNGTYADNSFTSTYDFNGTMQGRPVKTRHETSGKWLSADCGNVKPVGDLKR